MHWKAIRRSAWQAEDGRRSVQELCIWHNMIMQYILDVEIHVLFMLFRQSTP
jgi:hypothetical protein